MSALVRSKVLINMGNSKFRFESVFEIVAVSLHCVPMHSSNVMLTVSLKLILYLLKSFKQNMWSEPLVNLTSVQTPNSSDFDSSLFLLF